MKTSRQILNMSPRDLRRLVARLQVLVFWHERAHAGHPDDWPECDAKLAESRQTEDEVDEATKEPKQMSNSKEAHARPITGARRTPDCKGWWEVHAGQHIVGCYVSEAVAVAAADKYNAAR